jgi:Malate:quinone oxidoreductase (Mqo)
MAQMIENPSAVDVVLVGAGIMSATLGTVLKELERHSISYCSKRSTIAPWRVPRAGTTLGLVTPLIAS